MQKKPAAGTTGKNLSTLLELLNKKLNKYELSREQITITNALTEIEYKKETNRTEASDEEIISIDNLRRLKSELINIENIIVCCGKKAMLGICQVKCDLNKNCKVLYIKHLSTRGLIKIKNDMDGKEILSAEAQRRNGDSRSIKKIQNDNTLKRLEIICQNIIKQLKNEKNL